jgi:hypothetical protein
MRETFVNYLVENWDGGCIAYGRQPKGARWNLNNRYLSKVDAIRLLDADQTHIEHLVETGTLKILVRSKGKKRLIFMEVADIARLRTGH